MTLLLAVYFVTCIIYSFILYVGFKSDMEENNYKTFREFYESNKKFVIKVLFVCFTPLLNTLVFVIVSILQLTRTPSDYQSRKSYEKTKDFN